MKVRSAPLDDVWNELQFVLHDDGRITAGLTLRVFAWAYRALKAGMLAALRLKWQSQTVPQFPELGCEPFNLSETELDQVWNR